MEDRQQFRLVLGSGSPSARVLRLLPADNGSVNTTIPIATTYRAANRQSHETSESKVHPSSKPFRGQNRFQINLPPTGMTQRLLAWRTDSGLKNHLVFGDSKADGRIVSERFRIIPKDFSDSWAIAIIELLGLTFSVRLERCCGSSWNQLLTMCEL
jgi:hypothetical protein